MYQIEDLELSSNAFLETLGYENVPNALLHYEVRLKDSSGPRKKRSQSADDDERSLGVIVHRFRVRILPRLLGIPAAISLLV